MAILSSLMISNPSVTITREYLLKLGGWSALKEADQLLSGGRVESVEYRPPFLFGRVRAGQSSVQSKIKLSSKLYEVENLCSCRQAQTQGTICPHVLALGLKYMSPPPAPTPSLPIGKSPSATRPIPTPRSSRFTSENEAGTPTLQPTFILPLQLSEVWNAPQIRVIVEASLSGQPSRPLEVVLQTVNGTQSAPEDCLAGLRYLESRSHEPLPSMWLLNPKEFEEFLCSLIGCTHVYLGKRTRLDLSRTEQPVTVHLQTDASGRLHIDLTGHPHPEGTRLTSTRGQWWLTTNRLQFQPSLGPVLNQLSKGSVTLEGPEVARFLREELPALSKLATIERCPRTQAIEFVEQPPQIRAHLDGSSSSLSCRVEAVYEGNCSPITGSISITGALWKPDPGNPLRYLSRSLAIETQVRKTLENAGFRPGIKNPEFFVLTGEESCLRFLANQFPEWRKSWQFQIQPRLQAFLSQCDWIQPQAHFNSSGVEWLSVEFSYQSEDGQVELTPGEVQQLLQTGRCSRRLSTGRTALIASDKIEEWQETIRDCDEEAGTGTLQVGKEFIPYLSSALQVPRSTWVAPAELLEPEPLVLAANLQKSLRPYQRQGVEWMSYLARNRFAGILADEMGLGKTLQTLAYLQYRKETQSPHLPSLIVAPTSLLPNWQNECRRFTPSLQTFIWHGGDRHAQLSQMGKADLIITSYALLRRDLEMWRQRSFDVVVLDEAQQIKNRFSQSAQSVKLLQSDFRLILTGTPMENSLLDLWSMFDFLLPGYLGTAQSFRDRYEQPITKSGDTQAQARLTRRLKPFVLRRTKKEVAPELPERIDTILWTELSAEQKGIYQQILQAGRQEIFDLSGQGDQGKRAMAMLTTLTRLRQVSCHLDLLPKTQETAWKEPSGKIEAFTEALTEALEGGHRVLVFSQFVKMLKILETRLQAEHISYCYLDGSTVDRESEVNRFQKSPEIPVFLISLKAGGTGLNLTGADTVMHFDPWWNPAVEEQATARAHRIGQERIVTSYKLIARGTVEEKILELQARKKALLSQTVFSEQSLLQQLDSSEWKELLQFEAG